MSRVRSAWDLLSEEEKTERRRELASRVVQISTEWARQDLRTEMGFLYGWEGYYLWHVFKIIPPAFPRDRRAYWDDIAKEG